MAASRVAGGKTQIMPVWDSASRVPWDGTRLVVKLEDLAEFCRREWVTVNLGMPDEWKVGQVPVYTVRPTGGVGSRE